jgi:hypothetical protein
MCGVTGTLLYSISDCDVLRSEKCSEPVSNKESVIFCTDIQHLKNQRDIGAFESQSMSRQGIMPSISGAWKKAKESTSVSSKSYVVKRTVLIAVRT